jgi:hypothetical protein
MQFPPNTENPGEMVFSFKMHKMLVHSLDKPEKDLRAA